VGRAPGIQVQSAPMPCSSWPCYPFAVYPVCIILFQVNFLSLQMLKVYYFTLLSILFRKETLLRPKRVPRDASVDLCFKTPKTVTLLSPASRKKHLSQIRVDVSSCLCRAKPRYTAQDFSWLTWVVQSTAGSWKLTSRLSKTIPGHHAWRRFPYIYIHTCQSKHHRTCSS
jgi:hypothetical protein